jgi:hypothetical protein
MSVVMSSPICSAYSSAVFGGINKHRMAIDMMKASLTWSWIFLRAMIVGQARCSGKIAVGADDARSAPSNLGSVSGVLGKH